MAIEKEKTKQDDKDILRDIGVMFDAAKAELARLREAAQQAEALGQAQGNLARVRTQREEAYLRLGHAYYGMVERGEQTPPAGLKTLVADVKLKELDVLKQQADIAAILKEADAMVGKARKPAAKKKK